MATPAPSEPNPPRRVFPLVLIAIGIAALLGAGGVIAATLFSSSDVGSTDGDGRRGGLNVVLERDAQLGSPVPKEEQSTCYSSAHIRRATPLFRKPDGRRRLKLSARTEWGSPRILGVVKERAGWLGVQAAELENGEIAWVRRSRARLLCSRWSLHVDLSKRRIVVRKDDKLVRKLTVAVGRPDNPTPQGRFTVTDKLKVTEQGSPYGCCVLALTGHQTNLPVGWPGGDRLAVHATGDEASIGQPISSGCMRAKAEQARWLIHTIPLGAPIFIRA